MNIVIAQLKKDAIPLRGPLLGMGAILAVDILFRILVATGSLRMSGSPAVIGQFILLAILVVRLIHLDSLTSANAFWRTRPISRSQLLLAKAAFLILPVLALTAMSTSKSSLEAFEVFFPFLAATAAFATVTEKLSETMLFALKMFILAALVSMLISAVGAFLLLTLQAFDLLPWPQIRATGGAIKLNLGMSGSTLSLVVNILTFAGYLAVVVFQYLTLRTKLSVRLIFGILLFSILASSVANQITE